MAMNHIIDIGSLTKNKIHTMRILITYTVAIVLAALADGWMDNDMKTIAHLAEALSVLVLLIIPFIHKYRGGWGWYIAAYLCLRIGLFDPMYNLAAGNELFFHGTTSLWDMFTGALNPPVVAELFGRAVFLFAGVMIAIQQIRK
jgi:hypothetical protein